MRLSRATPEFIYHSVTIDGDGPPWCVEADEEQGYVVCAFVQRVPSGGILPLDDQDGRERTYTRYGAVTILPPDPKRPPKVTIDPDVLELIRLRVEQREGRL